MRLKIKIKWTDSENNLESSWSRKLDERMLWSIVACVVFVIDRNFLSLSWINECNEISWWHNGVQRLGKLTFAQVWLPSMCSIPLAVSNHQIGTHNLPLWETSPIRRTLSRFPQTENWRKTYWKQGFILNHW